MKYLALSLIAAAALGGCATDGIYGTNRTYTQPYPYNQPYGYSQPYGTSVYTTPAPLPLYGAPVYTQPQYDNRAARRGPNGDRDGDGVPNRLDNYPRDPQRW